jgi:hypothetical protein
MWDVIEHSVWYQDIALKAITAENEAAKIRQQRQGT